MRWIHKYEEKIEITTIFDHFKAIYLVYENYSVKCYAHYSTNEIIFVLKNIYHSENFSGNKHNTDPSQNHNKIKKRLL